ncbi:MAG: hypothetical protein JNM09_06805 [Blastocatellia bacterium]|nr:hypothetical protein [Blastocatellia bacterium]
MSQTTVPNAVDSDTQPKLTEQELNHLIEQKRREEHTKRHWGNVSEWYFDFGKEKMTDEERFTRAGECLLVVADLAAVLDSVDVRRVIEEGHDFALQRYANVMQMMALTAHCLLETYKPAGQP